MPPLILLAKKRGEKVDPPRIDTSPDDPNSLSPLPNKREPDINPTAVPLMISTATLLRCETSDKPDKSAYGDDDNADDDDDHAGDDDDDDDDDDVLILAFPPASIDIAPPDSCADRDFPTMLYPLEIEMVRPNISMDPPPLPPLSSLSSTPPPPLPPAIPTPPVCATSPVDSDIEPPLLPA